jgi:ferredoxin
VTNQNHAGKQVSNDGGIAIVYFSGTNVTHTYAQIIRDELLNRGCTVQLFNVTPCASRQSPLALDRFDGIIFGFPVFSDFAPSVINDWLPTLDGHARKCALFLTYGGRAAGYAHFHTKLLLEQAGFQLLFSAELLGRHSFNLGGWNILPERPDARDAAVAREYAALAIQRFSENAPPVFSLQEPVGYNQAAAALRGQPESTQPEIPQRGPTNPVRTSDSCSMCLDCETGCPTRSFDAETGFSDPRTCIGCMHCVTVCPENALKVDELKGIYESVLHNWQLTEEMMNAKQSRIITESRQAVL